ncbi:MAG: hypothetical protein AB7Q97_21225 [Gammaproteobacteria bacterium]
MPATARKMRTPGIDRRAGAGLLAALVTGVAAAHGGGGQDPGCWARVGNLRYEVTVWQPASSDARRLCTTLPAAGPTLLVFDAVDPALATLPVEIGLWPAGGAADYAASLWQDGAAAPRRIGYLPARPGAGGSLVLSHDFASPGSYVVALRARPADGGAWYGEFRFEVGVAAAQRWQVAALVLGPPFALATLLALEVRRRGSPTPAVSETA